MLTKAQLQEKIGNGTLILDGATGSNLRKMGMPKGVCTENWILRNPEVLVSLQRAYVQAGSQVLYAPTFQAQPIALAAEGLERHTEAINAHLVALSKSVDSSVLVAGNLTTLAAYTDSYKEENFDLLVENYRRQIKGLIDGGADLLAAETLLYPLEAEAILTAAELEGAGAATYSFTMQPDGSLFSGRDAGPVLQELERAGASAVGFNCVAANEFTPGLVAKLRRYVKGSLLCKPNAGDPVIDENGVAQYSLSADKFAGILSDCRQMGAQILGGCCGTDPSYISALKAIF